MKFDRLLEAGYAPQTAVRKAYNKYPVMDAMQGVLISELIRECVKGYGVDIGVTGNAIKSAIIKGMPYDLKTISKAMQDAWAPDGLNLSERLHSASSRVKNDVAEAISDANEKRTGYISYSKGYIRWLWWQFCNFKS